jgi:hypothetical protein
MSFAGLAPWMAKSPLALYVRVPLGVPGAGAGLASARRRDAPDDQNSRARYSSISRFQ